MNGVQLSIDVGGSFTDILMADAAGTLYSRKQPTNARDPGAACAAALAALPAGSTSQPVELLYSTTAALNGLLTSDLPAIGLVVTAGFRDLMETARFSVANATTPAPQRLVALEHVRELSARLDAEGREKLPLNTAEVIKAAEDLRSLEIGVVAVALLHSYRNPVHELAVAQIFREYAPDLRVVLSSTVLPELREYERALATCLNASLIPLLEQHVAAVSAASEAPAPRRVYLMQASGALSGADRARGRPLATALAGPSAAVVGMSWLGRETGYRDLITLDCGGTSTDIALVRNGEYHLTTAGRVAGFPLKLPMVDVLSIGAGGGSIAKAAPDGRWHVGPASAGAVPGPVCYSRGGTEVTLTDAQLVLGRLPAALLGGDLPLDEAAARQALTRFGAARGLDAEMSACGLLEIATHHMCGAIRRVATLRGQAPAELALLAMGGGGPLHGAELAALLGMSTVIVPPQPGLAAAYGMLVADVASDFIQALGELDSAVDTAAIASGFAALAAEAEAMLDVEGIAPDARVLERKLDLRYAGMTHEFTVACPQIDDCAAAVAATIEAFHRRFHELSGHSYRDREGVEIVNLRVTACGRRAKPRLPKAASTSASLPEPRTRRQVMFLGAREFLDSAIYDRVALQSGARITGPAVIEQYESTIIVPPCWRATGDAYGNLILQATGG